MLISIIKQTAVFTYFHLIIMNLKLISTPLKNILEMLRKLLEKRGFKTCYFDWQLHEHGFAFLRIVNGTKCFKIKIIKEVVLYCILYYLVFRKHFTPQHLCHTHKIQQILNQRVSCLLNHF